MKKALTVACMFLCTAFLWACATGQGGTTELEEAEWEEAEKQEADREEAEKEEAGGNVIVSEESVVSDGRQTADAQESDTKQSEQSTVSAIQMQGLMQGGFGGIGSGLLTYTLPQQESEDYRLCFFKEGRQESDFGKEMSEAVCYPLETADYIFPDVRENNVPIGKFVEIYFFDTITIGEDGTAGLAVVATYEVKGETRYDTRIYRWDGTGYSAEGRLIQEFNEKYGREAEYPVEELYHLASSNISESTASSAQDMSSQPEETAATAADSYYSAATGLSRSDVENYAARVKQMFLEHDWPAISSEISYPITISDITYNNSADFLDASDSFGSSLEEDFFSVLEQEDCTEMFCNWEGIMLGENGQIWISEVLDAEFRSQGLKIVAVNGMLK